MNYRVNWDYRSGKGGPWKAGDIIGLDPTMAEAIDHDSPGVLTEQAATEEPRTVEPQHDRMVKAAPRKRHTVANEGVMDTSTNAVKPKGD